MDDLWLVLLFWAGMGVFTIYMAVIEYEIKPLTLKEQFILFVKSLFYGPMTRSKLIRPIMISKRPVVFAVVYENEMNKLVDPPWSLYFEREPAERFRDSLNSDTVTRQSRPAATVVLWTVR